MIRSLGVIFFIFIAVLFLPFWLQAILYVLAILLIRYKVLLLLPAMFSDLWYAPSSRLDLANFKTTILVASLLLLYVLIIKNTRLLQNNGLAKK